MTTLAVTLDPDATDVEVTDLVLKVILADGR